MILHPITSSSTDTFIHPARNAVEKTNDMALLILTEEPPYTDFIRPICLPTKAFVPPSSVTQALIVAGWGSVTQCKGTFNHSIILQMILKKLISSHFRRKRHKNEVKSKSRCIQGLPSSISKI